MRHLSQLYTVIDGTEFNWRSGRNPEAYRLPNYVQTEDYESYPYPYIRLIIQLTHRNMSTKIKQMIKKTIKKSKYSNRVSMSPCITFLL